MGDWVLSLLLILSTVVLEISAVHNKPFPWQVRHGFLSSSNQQPPTPLRKRPPPSITFNNPFSIQSTSRQKTAKTPFQSELVNPIQSCVKKANARTSPSRIRDLILSLGEGAVKRRTSAGAENFHQRGLRRTTRSQIHENAFILPFLRKLGSHFGEYLRQVLGCQAKHRTYIAQPRSSRLSSPVLDPIQSISSSSNEQPQSNPSFVFERSAPSTPHIPLLPPQLNLDSTEKTSSHRPRLPSNLQSQQEPTFGQDDGSTSQPNTTKLSVSPSRPIQRSFHVDIPSSPGLEDFENPDGTTSITQPSRSDSSAPQPFEDLHFSPPPVDMSGLPPPSFTSSDSSTSTLPDIVQTVSDSSTRLTPMDPSFTFTSSGPHPYRVNEISLSPTSPDPTWSPPPPSHPATTLSFTGHASHTSHPPLLTTSSLTSPSRLSPSSHPGQHPGQGALYFGPRALDVKVLVEASGVVRKWHIAAPPNFGIINLLRYLAREQPEPIYLDNFDPHCFVLTQMVGLRIDNSHVWTITVLSQDQKVIFQDRCLPDSNLYILPGYTLVFRYTMT